MRNGEACLQPAICDILSLLNGVPLSLHRVMLAAVVAMTACATPRPPSHDAGVADAGPVSSDGGVDAGVDSGQPDGGLLDGGADAGLLCGFSDNALQNGDFECEAGSLVGWSATKGVLTSIEGRDGGGAARVTVDDAGARLVYALPLSVPLMPLCVQAHVRASVPYVRLVLLYGNSVEAFNAPTSAEWEPIPPTPLPTTTEELLLSVGLEAQTGRVDGQNAIAGQTVDVDDFVVWLPVDGGCVR